MRAAGMPIRLLKGDASPPGCDGHVREKDAGSVNSSAMCATEGTLSRRPVLSGGRDFAFQQPPSAAQGDAGALRVVPYGISGRGRPEDEEDH